MFNIDTTRLNESELRIMDDITAYAKKNPAPGILEAARICGCSASQVSKTVKKAGFSGYKKFIYYLYFDDQPKQEPLDELYRLKQVLEDFDTSIVDEFVDLIANHGKIILFGYGPSHICAQYFEYKLRFCTSAFIATPPDEHSVETMLDETSLLAIFTTTGQYRSFENLTHHAKTKAADVVVVSEEFNPTLMENCTRYFMLTRHKQPDTLRPYEKTRTVFFIFFEEVIKRLLNDRNN